MKKLLKNLGLILIVSFGIALLNSCVATPECETYRYNDVTVVNNTGVPIVVDVTYVGSDYNDERYLGVNQEETVVPYNLFFQHLNSSTTYYRMDSGSLWVWGNAGYGWSKNTINTRACQTFTYTWHPLKNGEVVVEVGWEDGGFIGESEYNQPPSFEMSKGQ